MNNRQDFEDENHDGDEEEESSGDLLLLSPGPETGFCEGVCFYAVSWGA